jgi:carboxyl-terminal processing protease
LDYFSKDIKSIISVEIVKRYYYQRGSIIQQLKDDNDLQQAIEILNDSERYKRMLSAPAKR